MHELSESESCTVRLELEVTGTVQQLRAALRRYIREHCEPLLEGDYVQSAWENSTREEVLFEILHSLQLAEQIRRILHPLTVKPVSSGLTVGPINLSENEKI